MTTIIGGVPSGDSSTSTTAEVVVVDMASILTGARGRTRGVKRRGGGSNGDQWYELLMLATRGSSNESSWHWTTTTHTAYLEHLIAS